MSDQIKKEDETNDGPLISIDGIVRPDELFHYCSEETFLCILKSSSLWLSDADNLNDSLEGKWLDKVVDELREDSELLQWSDSGHIYHDYKLFKSTFFIICFSEKEDLLSQWRAYADNGKGVSIGFSIQPSLWGGNLTLSQILRWEELGGHLERVVYSKLEQKEILLRIFKYIDHWVKKCLNPKMSLYFYDAVVDTGRDGLSYLSRLMKHPGFSEECEWRIIYDGVTDLSSKGVSKKINTRVQRNESVNYHVWKFTPSLITKVVLGPKCKLTIEETKKQMQKLGFSNVSITKSEVPYR